VRRAGSELPPQPPSKLSPVPGARVVIAALAKGAATGTTLLDPATGHRPVLMSCEPVVEPVNRRRVLIEGRPRRNVLVGELSFFFATDAADRHGFDRSLRVSRPRAAAALQPAHHDPDKNVTRRLDLRRPGSCLLDAASDSSLRRQTLRQWLQQAQQEGSEPVRRAGHQAIRREPCALAL
jgi:hypothetical protein